MTKNFRGPVDERVEVLRGSPKGEEGGDREKRHCLVEDQTVGEKMQKGDWKA